jgi:hypothetical protein
VLLEARGWRRETPTPSASAWRYAPCAGLQSRTPSPSGK